MVEACRSDNNNFNCIFHIIVSVDMYFLISRSCNFGCFIFEVHYIDKSFGWFNFLGMIMLFLQLRAFKVDLKVAESDYYKFELS